MSSSSQQHCRSGKYRGLMNFAKAHYDHLSFIKLKTDAHDLKISVRPELATKISNREFSDVRRNMQGLNHKSVTINAQVRKGGLHSILFDNSGNKTDKHQILGVILDACNHFIHRKTKNRRYITFSSGLNGLKANVPVRNENCETGVYDGNFSGFRFKKKYNFCLVALLAVTMCFFVSCGGGSSKPANESGGDSVSNFGKLGSECYPNKTCDEGLLCDKERNICVEDPENPINDSDKTDSGSPEKPDSDSDNADSIPDDGNTQSDDGDTAPDGSDTTPDGGDSQPDSDTTPDDGDSAPDSDNTGTANDNPTNLPECSPTSATPCIDSEVLDADSEKAYLIWSGKSPERMRWVDAVEYCSKLDEGGFNDWQFPTLAALQTLLRNGTYCELGDHCSKFGEITFFWSSTKGYGVDFYTGGIPVSKNVDESFDVRCVRKEITSRQANCTGLPETAQWNSVSEITQTWSWGSPLTITHQGFSTSVDYGSLSWTPSPVSVISDEPSTTECRFKCNAGLFGSKCNLTCEEFKARHNVLCKSDCSTCGCKAGYVWVGELASYYVDTEGDPDYNCIPCTASEMLVEMIRNRDSYCPGGDDLKDKFSIDTSLSNQIEKCPQYTIPNDKLDDCVCELGVPPPPKEECYPAGIRKKPLIINPKVNN